ncbi:acetylating acetaldehyde dehydrogenase [Agaribacterium haliotis]|uniref:acetylating acetaldehyde dehydrogenase n=1 Tax=Agaribacterium haliotis TaxID=2013869 RepID=UPI00130433DD|nr:acetylating acetaldehyde dehydrogenase [Agaribacterium haliotis]
MKKTAQKLRVGILGTGKIGTDLLLKVLRSDHLQCTIFAGRNLQSPGMQKAQQLGVPLSDKGIQAFSEGSIECDLVFDATGAEHHREHAKIFAAKGIKAIDLTPAKIGPFCIPALNEQVILKENNINMVTCGGQASVPFAEAVKQACASVKSVKVHTLVSDDSIGQATIDNVDDYYATTSKALCDFAGLEQASVELQVDEPGRQPTMCTTLSFDVPNSSRAAVEQALKKREREIQAYVPGLRIELLPNALADEVLSVRVLVSGLGDWIPAHAGNLDIINCAAIAAAERFAVYKLQSRSGALAGLFEPLTRIWGGRQLASA